MKIWPLTLILGITLATAALAKEPVSSPTVSAGAADVRASSSIAPVTGLPLPRFVTMRSEPVNVRTGPGERYPVKWVLRKKGIPLEIIAEYENWRKVRDWQGTEGWVNQALLTSKRAAVVYPDTAVLRQTADPIARPIARIEAGVLAQLKICQDTWCLIEVGQLEGWINKQSLWGVKVGEVFEK